MEIEEIEALLQMAYRAPMTIAESFWLRDFKARFVEMKHEAIKAPPELLETGETPTTGYDARKHYNSTEKDCLEYDKEHEDKREDNDNDKLINAMKRLR